MEGGGSPVNGLMQQNVKYIVTPAPTLSGASPMGTLKSPPTDLKTQVQAWSKIIDVAEREIERKSKEMQDLKTRLRSVEWEALSRTREVSTLNDKVKELEYKLVEKETQVKTIVSGLDLRENQERSLDNLITAAIEDKVSWEKRYRHAVSELELKTQYLDDKENFWSSEMQQLENTIQDQEETIAELKEQLLGLRKMQESGNMAAFGRQSAALKERSSLIHGNSDLAKKLTETNKKVNAQRQLIGSLEAQLDLAKAQNSAFTSTLIPILEDSGLFLHTIDAYEVSESIKALIDSLMAELRLTGKQQKFKLSSKSAKELINIKEQTMESQQKQTKLLKELEYTTREAEKLTKAIMTGKEGEEDTAAASATTTATAVEESEEEEEEEEEKGEEEEDYDPYEEYDEADALRRDRSATVIQSNFRALKARKEAKEMHNVQIEATKVIQKHYRLHKGQEEGRKRDKAAKVIQAGARKWSANKKVKQVRSEQAEQLEDEVLTRAAKILQTHERARQSRKKYHELKLQNEKAITIQKHFRSNKAKKILKHKKATSPAIEEFGAFCNDSVPTIGSVVRACGMPTNGTTLCLFNWTRAEASGGAHKPIAGAQTPEYTISPDDVGKIVGVQCTPTNDSNEHGLPATAIVNEGRPIQIGKEVVSEITRISTKGTATYRGKLVKYGKSSASADRPVDVTIMVDRKCTSIMKKSNLVMKIKYEHCPQISLHPDRPELCPIKMTAGNEKNKDVHIQFPERANRDDAVLLIRHFTSLVKPKKGLLSFLSKSKKQK